MKATCYHARLAENNTVKTVGGTITAETLDQAAEQICAGKRGFTLRAKSGGRVTFVDSRGREVRVYLSIDPVVSPQGRAALAEFNAAEEKRRREVIAQEKEKQSKLEALIDSIGIDAAISKLQEIQ